MFVPAAELEGTQMTAESGNASPATDPPLSGSKTALPTFERSQAVQVSHTCLAC